LEAFVTGSTGFIGRVLINELLARHWRVRALVRNRARARLLPPGVSILHGGLSDGRALLEGARGTDVVFHLAAATSGDWDTHAEVTVEGTRRVLRACHEAGARRFILVSSTVVYDKRGQKADAVFDENSPLLAAAPGTGAYARGKLEAERLALQYSRHDGARSEVVIVRAGLVYGRERLTFPHLGELVGQTRVAYGRPSLLLPLVEIHSCTDALLRVATEPEAAGKIYNLVDAHLTTRRDYLDALRSVTGYPQRVIYLPVRPVALASTALAALGRLRGRAAATDVSAQKIWSRAYEVRYDTKALQRDTRWQPLEELERGLARAGLAAARGTPRDIRRAGIIGAGMIARAHMAALQRIPGVRITGILDANLAAAQALASEAGDVSAFDDATRFYQEARPQLVHVLTPPHVHAAVAQEALRHGAHVLLEKPATTTLAECDLLLEAAEAGNLTVGVDETVAWDPLVRRARSALLYGILGDLVHVDVFMSFDLSRGRRLERILGDPAAWEHRLAGGPLEDLLPHPLAVVRALCGALELRHWHIQATGRLACDFPDELRLSLGARQLSAQVGLSLSARPDEFLLTVRGSRATLRVDLQSMLFDCLTPLPGPRAAAQGTRVLWSASRMMSQTIRNAMSIAMRRRLPPASPAHLIRAHYAALARGELPPAPLSEARADVAIARSLWAEPAPGGVTSSAPRTGTQTAAAGADRAEMTCDRSA
jgi:predicted dehydrogenase/nucleoside-diphosphate-sugar epimerase